MIGRGIAPVGPVVNSQGYEGRAVTSSTREDLLKHTALAPARQEHCTHLAMCAHASIGRETEA
jgi:hypothetical protein